MRSPDFAVNFACDGAWPPRTREQTLWYGVRDHQHRGSSSWWLQRSAALVPAHRSGVNGGARTASRCGQRTSTHAIRPPARTQKKHRALAARTCCRNTTLISVSVPASPCSTATSCSSRCSKPSRPSSPVRMASGESDCLLANNDCPPERRGLWPELRRRAFLSHVNERAAHR